MEGPQQVQANYSLGAICGQLRSLVWHKFEELVLLSRERLNSCISSNVLRFERNFNQNRNTLKPQKDEWKSLVHLTLKHIFSTYSTIYIPSPHSNFSPVSSAKFQNPLSPIRLIVFPPPAYIQTKPHNIMAKKEFYLPKQLSAFSVQHENRFL